MEGKTRSPETESRERAASSEPCGTRLNPFEDGDASSRKRRRTSMNADSRSLSVETNPSSSPGKTAIADADADADIDVSSEPSSATTIATSATMASAARNNNNNNSSSSNSDRNGTAMNIDAGNAAPQTPENTTSSSVNDDLQQQQTPAPPPSHVTLSLRNSARRTLDSIPSSAASSSSPPASPTPGSLPIAMLDRDDVQASVEPSDVDVDADAEADDATLPSTTTTTATTETTETLATTTATDAPNQPDPDASADVDLTGSTPLSTSDTASPPVEIVTIQPDDEDDDFEPVEPQVTLLAGDEDGGGGGLVDPTPDFPYRSAVETHAEVMAKLMNYIGSDVQVAQHLRDWIDSYLIFARNAPFQLVYASHQQHRSLWVALPDLLWGLPNLRTTPSFAVADRNLRDKLLEFCDAFARLTAYFVEYDYTLLQRLGSAAESVQPREFISSHYLLALATATRRDAAAAASQKDGERLTALITDRDDVSEVLEQFVSCYRVPPCGTLLLLDRMLEALVALMAKVPKIIDNFSHICAIASFVVREAYRKLAGGGLRQQTVNALKTRVELGYKMFTVASTALSSAIDNHITCLSQDNTGQLITALGDLLCFGLKVDHPDAARTVGAFQELHPDIPPECVPDAFAMEWRFGMFCRLIMCSQMQLRVMAVTSLCQELVACWRRYGEQAAEAVREVPVLQFVSHFLTSTRVVAYLLGPTCHPEITAESGNIVGFLVVTKTYTNEHTDLFWQTVTTTQDPRISEALIRMTSRIANLLPYDLASYLCQKFLVLPMAAFTPTMREFCDAILRHLSSKASLEHPSVDTVPFSVCLRLLRDASVPGNKTPTAYPDIQGFAIEKLSELLRNVGIEAEQRQDLYRSCLSDLQDKSSTTTLGSLCAINIINRHYGGRDLAALTTEHHLTELVVDELDDAIRTNRNLAFPAVLSGITNAPRRDLLFQILSSHSYTMTPELSARLWNLMTGPVSACIEDRNASWKILIACAKRSRNENNPFLTVCLSEFLPQLPRECFCEGLLEFLRERLMPLLNDTECALLDIDDDQEDPNGHNKAAEAAAADKESGKGIDRVALEQLWRVVLTALPGTVERPATNFLVEDIYIDSQSIRAFSVYRARKIHLALVSRCLQQLSAAAKTLRSFTRDSSASSDEESMVIVGSEALVHEQELLFVRSLQVLREFLRLYRTSPHFSTPDLRTLLSAQGSQASSGAGAGGGVVEGESAELKYQSFDGDAQTEVRPLHIGRRNTAASLLASLKEATGFDNYRIYYRGQAFVPQESDICRSLDDLRIHNGLILVKREDDPQTPSTQARPGVPPVDAEILGHFHELWEYMSMREGLSNEIYQFLCRLPVDDHFFRVFEKPDVAYTDVFCIGQPYKSLYALYALRQYLALRHQPVLLAGASGAAGAIGAVSADDEQPTEAITQVATPKEDDDDEETAEQPAQIAAKQQNLGSEHAVEAQKYAVALTTATRLAIAAIRDPHVTQTATSAELQSTLCYKLVDMLVFVLNDPLQDGAVRDSLDAPLLDRLMTILSAALDEEPTDTASRVVHCAFQAIMEACSLSRAFWTAFRQHAGVGALVERLLLGDDRMSIRQLAEKQIGDRVLHERPGGSAAVAAAEFREFFWPVVWERVPTAMRVPTKCEDLFNLALNLLHKMLESKSPVLDLPALLGEMSSLLLSYTTLEDVTQPDRIDYAAYGLIHMFQSIPLVSQKFDLRDKLPRGFAHKLFWKHLFPPWKSAREDDEAKGYDLTKAPYPSVVVHPQTRVLLMQTILELVCEDVAQLPILIRNLDQLVPCEKSEDDDPYHYDLPQQFDRTKALRAPNGYVGLRNLSNTCYFNSLFTQLFMNVEFRRFIMRVQIRDETHTQHLLFQTRVLFSFMQDSIRRYVDTQHCVASVKTYDDTPIDIHNQMDVDEFYNLLFDRWEGQLLSADEKREFRAFYGGQLVQQVRSKECEHVSERLEPFSAIQCDIKGKASLQESLQAYVGGEIMEGDNKYKCSTCDKHVDAVKRACLKDIPDHLIFHLKRFDFNLRTLQRSKINDYFAFPHKIDMRPYTIDQLSNPSEEQSADIFELVGVLVHSGTAESGHYYSYIREHPSSKATESWVEFNDDTVSTWDPSQLEALCFGGSDYRTSNNYSGGGGEGSTNGMAVDKSFSAYMLFYQRSSSLAQEQDALVRSGLTSPARAVVPAALSDHICSENTSLVRRHALFDPQQILFVTKVLGYLQFASPGGRCSADHGLENLAVQMALSHLDQVASRTKELPDFLTLANRIQALGSRCARCYVAVVDYFDERHDVLRQMLQRHPEPFVRSQTGALLIAAFEGIKKAFPEQYGMFLDDQDADIDDDEDEDDVIDDDDDFADDDGDDGTGNAEENGQRNRAEAIRRGERGRHRAPTLRDSVDLGRNATILHSAAYMLRVLWDHFHVALRSWPELFGFMLAFVNMGRLELATFLDVDGFRRALLIIAADSAIPMEPQFNRMLVAVQRRLPNRPPAYENVIALIDAALRGMYPDAPVPRASEDLFVEDNVSRYLLALQTPAEGDLPMSRAESVLLARDWVRDYGNVFVDKLIGINQNAVATDAIVARLMATHPAMESKVFATLKANLASSSSAPYQRPFLRVAVVFFRHARSSELLFQLMKHIADQCRSLTHGEGRAYFETICELFHGPVVASTAATATAEAEARAPDDAIAALHGLPFVPLWAPGLLSYYDTSVSNDVELFLRDNLFQYGTSPQFDESEGGAERAAMHKLVAKRLGVECLRYIQLHFVQRNLQIGNSIVAAFQRVITECTPFYLAVEDADDEAADDDDEWTNEFRRLNSIVPDLLRRLAVEDLEDDGSEWNSSRCSSDQGDSLGDVSMQAAGDMNDVDMS